MHVAAPVLGKHHDVLDAVDAAEELALLVGELGVGVVLLGAGPGVAHLGHVVLPGHPGGKALRVEGNRQLGHVVLASVRVVVWGVACCYRLLLLPSTLVCCWFTATALHSLAYCYCFSLPF